MYACNTLFGIVRFLHIGMKFQQHKMCSNYCFEFAQSTEVVEYSFVVPNSKSIMGREIGFKYRFVLVLFLHPVVPCLLGACHILLQDQVIS